MTADREIANAISRGINCIAEIASALREVEHAGIDDSGLLNPEWPKTLQEMEGAMDAVLAGTAITSLVINSEDVDRIHRTRTLVSAWLKDGHASDELSALAKATLGAFGLARENAEKDVPL